MSIEREAHLPAHLSSVTRARHFVRDVLMEWELPAVAEDAQLGTSELVANAVRHAGTDLRLSIRLDRSVTISIRDGQPELRRPVAAEANFLAESGRGLHIVAAISQDWGITSTDGGKVVWFVLAIPTSDRADADVLTLRRRHPTPEVPFAAGPDGGPADLREQAGLRADALTGGRHAHGGGRHAHAGGERSGAGAEEPAAGRESIRSTG